jgi:hypothetical protein
MMDIQPKPKRRGRKNAVYVVATFTLISSAIASWKRRKTRREAMGPDDRPEAFVFEANSFIADFDL